MLPFLRSIFFKFEARSENVEMFYEFENHDRFGFPEGIVRVTSGHGGEAILIFGTEKTILVDCGMAYCGEETVANIENALSAHGRMVLDGMVMSHSHYDHIGALPYIKKRWPNMVVYGAAKAKAVFERPGAKELMYKLGTNARNMYSDSKEEILTDGLVVDEAVGEGDKISIGNQYLYVLETKGHTDCSLTYVLQPESIMFASESTGVFENKDYVHSSILKSYKESLESTRKCREFKPNKLICPHYGLVPDWFIDEYFELYLKCSEEKALFLKTLSEQGLSEEEIHQEFMNRYWKDEYNEEHPKAAFEINAHHMEKVILKEVNG